MTVESDGKSGRADFLPDRRERLRRLVEFLPEAEFHAAERYLEFLVGPDPVIRAAVHAPWDDEPLETGRPLLDAGQQQVLDGVEADQASLHRVAHPPGHAQVDFGEAVVELRGQREKVAFFCLILPHSNIWFVKAYPRETTEAFLDGHVSAFAFLGGVPRSILYDNTTLAVARILGDGTRRRTQAFSHLQSHYLFRDRFGRPGTGELNRREPLRCVHEQADRAEQVDEGELA